METYNFSSQSVQFLLQVVNCRWGRCLLVMTIMVAMKRAVKRGVMTLMVLMMAMKRTVMMIMVLMVAIKRTMMMMMSLIL